MHVAFAFLVVFSACLMGGTPVIAEQPTDESNIWFGVRGGDIATLDRNEVLRRGLPTTKGVYVDLVAYGSPAAKAGVKRGDIIKFLNGDLVESAKDMEVVLKAQPGDKVLLKVLRQVGTRNKLLSLRVTLREIVPQSARDYVKNTPLDSHIKSALEHHLANYRMLLIRHSEQATIEGDASEALTALAQLYNEGLTAGTNDSARVVDKLLAEGPWSAICIPTFGEIAPVEVDGIGQFGAVKVLQVLDDQLVRIEIDNATILVSTDATNLSDDDVADLGVARITGTTAYTTVLGAVKKAFTAEPFDFEVHLRKARQQK